MLKRIALALSILGLLVSEASAVTCFWVGGTAQWTAVNAASWASSSGGAASSCAASGGVPGALDAGVFDASSGGGTVTPNFVALNIGLFIMSDFTGTIDFSVNNNSPTMSQVIVSGTGTRTLRMGSGTWTFPSTGIPWYATTTTNLTFNANTSTMHFTDTVGQKVFRGGGLTYNTITIDGGGISSSVWITGANTFANFNLAGGNTIQLTAGLTTHITNSFNWVGTSTGLLLIKSDTNASAATITSASNGTMTWTAFRDVNFNGGGTFTATSSFNLVGPTLGVTVTPPSSGSTTACILGGWLLWRDLPGNLNDNYPAWLDKAA